MQTTPFLLICLLLLTLGVFIAGYQIQQPKEIRTGQAALIGDANNDGKVDILDFQLLSNSFGRVPGQSGYDSRCNFNGDGAVDILDFQILSNNFGTTASITITPTNRLTITPTLRPTPTLSGPTPSLTPTTPGQMFISNAEIRSKPTSGTGWTYLKSRADLTWPVPNIGSQTSITQTDVLAAALVYARDPLVYSTYRTKVINELKQVCGTETGAAQLLNLARTLYGYVVAADMVQMDYSTLCNNGETWLHFLQRIRTHVIVGSGSSLWTTLESCSKYTSTNWGAYALSSHLAVSYALNDTAMISRDIEIFKRYLGDTTSTAAPFVPSSGYNYNNNGITWDMTPTLKRGINPVDSSNSGRSGAIIEDSLRLTGGAGDSVPCCSPNDVSQGYQEEAMDGIFSTTQLLRAHGMDITPLQNQALLRAFIHWKQSSPSHWSAAYWKYLPYAINYWYGTNYPVSGESATPYRHMGFGTWLFTH